MRGIGGWLDRRRSLSRAYWRIRLVEEDSARVIEELERRRDGLAPRRLSVPELRRALDEVSDPRDVVPVR